MRVCSRAEAWADSIKPKASKSYARRAGKTLAGAVKLREELAPDHRDPEGRNRLDLEAVSALRA